MIVRADIVEDFSRSLSDLNDVVVVKADKRDTFFCAAVKDAQLFSFLRAVELLRALLGNIQSEECDDCCDDCDSSGSDDTEGSVMRLLMFGIIEEAPAMKLLQLLDSAEFLVLERSWLDHEDAGLIYDSSVLDIPRYCDLMGNFLETVSTDFLLVDTQEVTNDAH